MSEKTEKTEKTETTASAPAKPGIFARAGEAIKNFAYEHPVLTGVGCSAAGVGIFKAGEVGYGAIKSRLAAKPAETVAASLYGGVSGSRH